MAEENGRHAAARQLQLAGVARWKFSEVRQHFHAGGGAVEPMGIAAPAWIAGAAEPALVAYDQFAGEAFGVEGGAGKAGKEDFFFEKKKQKTFNSPPVARAWNPRRNKSLFVLFFRKEHFLPPSPP